MQRKQPDMTCIELIDTPPAELYRLVADVTTWPVIFEQVVQVQRLQRGHGAEWFRLWTVAGGRVRTATLRRWLNPDRLRIAIDADPDDSGLPSPFAGRWSFHPVADGRSEVVLDQPAEVRDAPRVLAALNRVAGQGHPLGDVLFSFADTLPLETDAEHAYAFVADARRWPERLPHVSRVVLHEHPPGVQHLEMDTITADGGRHTTRSVRVCFPASRIVYKQLLPPTLLLGHAGAWDFSPAGVATATHTVAVDVSRTADVLGEGATLAQAQQFLRDVLAANSRTTLRAAAEHTKRQAA